MAIQAQKTEVGQVLTLAQRRDYMQLPLEERRRRLEAQADRVADHYEQALQRKERETWQGGDIVEP